MNRIPFRWNLARREQLGSLVHGVAAEDYPGFVAELRQCCVRIVCLAGAGDLVFVGRSPESIFDYLSGLLSDTSWSERCVLLNFSMRHASVDEIAGSSPQSLRAVREQFDALGLSPDDIVSSARPKVFIDLVATGATFGHLGGLLEHWADEVGIAFRAVRRRVRFVGIVERMHNSPNTWRWYQRVPWAKEFPRSALRSVSVPPRLWDYLGNWQKKVARSHSPRFWGSEELRQPPRQQEHLEALRLALFLYERGRQSEERQDFSAGLAAQREMAHPWLRTLVLELRRS